MSQTLTPRGRIAICEALVGGGAALGDALRVDVVLDSSSSRWRQNGSVDELGCSSASAHLRDGELKSDETLKVSVASEGPDEPCLDLDGDALGETDDEGVRHADVGEALDVQ